MDCRKIENIAKFIQQNAEAIKIGLGSGDSKLVKQALDGIEAAVAAARAEHGAVGA